MQACQTAEERLVKDHALTPSEAHQAIQLLLATGIAPDQMDEYLSDLIVLIEAGLDNYFDRNSSDARTKP